MGRQNPPPNLSAVLDARIQHAMAGMNCISVGTIEAFNPADQTATVSINYKRIIKDVVNIENGLDTQDKIEEYPLLVKCPVFILTGGTATLTVPIAKGDTCILLFCDREIDSWFTNGSVTYPASPRMHDLNDALAVVGIRSLANPVAAFNTIIASLVDKTGERLSQAGDVKATARTTAPSGWVLCYGQAISRTTYDVLFTAIGTTYGAGDGSTTFNVPDLRGRTIVGLDNMGGSQAGRLTTTYTPNRNTLGAGVGEEAHQLTIAEMPEHDHGVNSSSENAQYGSGQFSPGGSMNRISSKTGGNTPHNTVQPGMMLNWIIKF